MTACPIERHPRLYNLLCRAYLLPTKRRSDQGNVNEDVTYTMDTITLYKGETGETYEQEITFITGGNDAACGVNLEIGEEYLLGLYRTTADPFQMETGGQLTVGLCDLAQVWSSVSDDEKAQLGNGCNIDACDGTCSDSQVGIFERGQYS